RGFEHPAAIAPDVLLDDRRSPLLDARGTGRAELIGARGVVRRLAGLIPKDLVLDIVALRVLGVHRHLDVIAVFVPHLHRWTADLKLIGLFEVLVVIRSSR